MKDNDNKGLVVKITTRLLLCVCTRTALHVWR